MLMQIQKVKYLLLHDSITETQNTIISYIIVNYCITSKNFLVPKMSI